MLELEYKGKKVQLVRDFYTTGSVRLYLKSSKGDIIKVFTVGLGHITEPVACINEDTESQLITRTLVSHNILIPIDYTYMSGSTASIMVCRVNF